jgi:hypothetical protein
MGPMEAFTNTIALRTLNFCFRVFNVFDSQVKLILVIFSLTTVLRATIGENA